MGKGFLLAEGAKKRFDSVRERAQRPEDWLLPGDFVDKTLWRVS
jgi:hypothetical protein